MNSELNNVFPEKCLSLSREEKEDLLNQKALSLWFTGFSGSGKTSIASCLEKKMHSVGFLVKVLDGDVLRATVNKDLDFSEEGRMQNIQRAALLNNEFLSCGIIVINCFISPTKAIRQTAKNIIGENDFLEIYIDCPLSVCEQRDSKGLYAKARAGLIRNFTGIDSAYEPPQNPFLKVETDKLSIEEAASLIFNKISELIKKT